MPANAPNATAGGGTPAAAAATAVDAVDAAGNSRSCPGVDQDRLRTVAPISNSRRRHDMRKRKPCSIYGVSYPSHSAAAAALGLTRQRIHQLVAQSESGRKLRKRCKPVTIGGVTYLSTTEAARALGVSYWVARYLAKSGRVTRRCRQRAACSMAKAESNQPPTRNAVNILRRVAAVLQSSVWIRRLPLSHYREIAKAGRILQRQAELLQSSAQNRPQRTGSRFPDRTAEGA